MPRYAILRSGAFVKFKSPDLQMQTRAGGQKSRIATAGMGDGAK